VQTPRTAQVNMDLCKDKLAQQTRTALVTKDPCRNKLEQTNRTAELNKDPCNWKLGQTTRTAQANQCRCKGGNLCNKLQPLRLTKTPVREKAGATQTGTAQVNKDPCKD
jgi:hypothetical protein